MSSTTPARQVQFERIREPKDIVAEDYVILLIGGTGFGRTTFVNRLLNKPEEKHDKKPDKKKGIAAYRVHITQEYGLDLTHFSIVDCPGVDDKDVDVDKAMEPWLASFLTAHIAGVFYLYDISTRNGTTLRKANNWARGFISQRRFGTAFSKSLFLVQTRHTNTQDSVKQDNITAVKNIFSTFLLDEGQQTINFDTEDHDLALAGVKLALTRYDDALKAAEDCKQADIISALRRRHIVPSFRQFCDFKVDQDGEPHLDDVVIVAMGATGSGMSSFISTLTTGEVPQDDGRLSSQTAEVVTARFVPPVDLKGPRPPAIVLVDTPGLDKADLTDLQILEQVAGWLKVQYSGKIPLSGLLYFRRINDPRMTGTDIHNLEIFRDLCGKKIMDRVVFVTTMWDHAESEEGQFDKNMRDLRQNYWKGCLKQNARIVEYRQRSREAAFKVILPLIANTLIPPDKPTTIEERGRDGSVRLQRELTKTPRLAATSAGQAVYKKLPEKIEIEQEKLEELQRNATSASDSKVVQQEGRLEAMKNDQRALKLSVMEKIAQPKRWLV